MTSGNERKSTGDLFLMLEKTDDIRVSWETLSEDMDSPTFMEYIKRLLDERGLNAEKLGTMAFLSRSFSYQICSGARIPGRDIIIRIALALRLSLDETQRLLTIAGRNSLYPKVKRDSVLIYAVLNQKGILGAEELLTSLKLPSLI